MADVIGWRTARVVTATYFSPRLGVSITLIHRVRKKRNSHACRGGTTISGHQPQEEPVRRDSVIIVIGNPEILFRLTEGYISSSTGRKVRRISPPAMRR